MPIESFTGLPGHGKTSLMMEHLLAAAERADRPLFASGIDGLEPGIATLLPDPRQWNAVKPGEVCTCHDTEDSSACDSHVVPNGSVIYVDEAWKWFGHLQNATRQANPPHVLQLAEHRHRGIDFVWTFQLPNQIFPFARGLMAEHHHVVRRFGTQMIDVFTWQELNEDVKSASQREAALRKTRTLPTAVRGKYKSAEVHTIKARIPWKVIMIPVFVIGAVVSGWFAYSKLKPDAFAASVAGGASGPATAGQLVTGTSSSASDKPPRTHFEYAKAHLPRFGSMPWTAEVYDSRSPTADPHLYCMSGLEGADAQGQHKGLTCTCLTEQGTAYEISQPECRTLARQGPIYNHYAERKERDQASQLAPIAAPSAAAVNAGAVVSSAAAAPEVFPRSAGYQPGG